jgi:hypothetical protein
MGERASSWYRLPNGRYRRLTTTQDLLSEMLPAAEDLQDARDELARILRAVAKTRNEAQELLVRSRRQRLDVHQVKR